MTNFDRVVESRAADVRYALHELENVETLAGFMHLRTLAELDYAIRQFEYGLENIKRHRDELAKRQHNMGVAA
jgi:hypothetical protein